MRHIFMLVNNLSLGKLCVKMTSTFQCCHNITTENARCYLSSTCRTHTISYHMRSTHTLNNNEREAERRRGGGREEEREYRQRFMNKLTLAPHALKINCNHSQGAALHLKIKTFVFACWTMHSFLPRTKVLLECNFAEDEAAYTKNISKK